MIQGAPVDDASALSIVAVLVQLSAVNANGMLTMLHTSTMNLLTTSPAT